MCIRDRLLWDKIGKIQYQPQSEVVMTGHSHIDVAWLWTVRETTRKCGRTFSNTLALMEHYPDFIFAQSQAYLYAKTKQVYPELYTPVSYTHLITVTRFLPGRRYGVTSYSLGRCAPCEYPALCPLT